MLALILLIIENIQIKKIVLLIAILFCWFKSYSQSPVYTHHTVEDGLPSSTVYSAFQDSKGYMWFATDAGVSRFNGYEFENLDASDGLEDNTVFLITEDHKGRIWFGSFNCQLSYYENDRIYPYQYNHEIAKLIKERSAMHAFQVDKNDNVFIGFIELGFFQINSQGLVKQIIKTPDKDESYSAFFEINGSNYWGIVPGNKMKGHVPLKENKDILNCSFDNHEAASIEFERQKDKEFNIFLGTYQKQKFVILYDVMTLFQQKNKASPVKIKIPFIDKNRVYTIFEDQEFLWFCVEKNGVYKCKIANNQLTILDHYLEKKEVARVFRDNEDGYWFQTLTEGIYYMSSDNIKYTSLEDRYFTSIAIDTLSGQLYGAFKDGAIMKITHGTTFDYQPIFQCENFAQTLKYNYHNNALLIGDICQHIIYYQNNAIRSFEGANRVSNKSFITDSNKIYRATDYGLSIIENGKEIYYSNTEGVPKLWCTSLIKNNGQIWVGTKNGIRVYENKKITNPFKNNKDLSASIICMERLNDDTFLIGTHSQGILVIKGDRLVKTIKEKDGLASDIVRNIHVDNQKTIWVGTNKGISRIDYNKDGNYQIYNLTKKHGLSSEEVIDICSYKNTIYAASSTGLMTFDKTEIEVRSTPPSLFINQFIVNLTKRKIQDNMHLSYKENAINIHFEALNYRSLGEVEYQYRIIGIDTNWTTTATRSIQFQSLSPDDYLFEVKAKNEDGVWSSPASIAFTINPPFWKTNLFRFVFVAFWLGLILLSFRVNILVYNKHIQQELFNRLLKKLGKQSYIFIEADKQKIRINENEVLYIQAFRNYVEIVTTTKKHLYRSTITDMMEKLTYTKYIRVHRSYIVQKDKIDSISEKYIRIGNDEIPIGKTYQKKVVKFRNDFFRLNS